MTRFPGSRICNATWHDVTQLATNRDGWMGARTVEIKLAQHKLCCIPVSTSHACPSQLFTPPDLRQSSLSMHVAPPSLRPAPRYCFSLPPTCILSLHAAPPLLRPALPYRPSLPPTCTSHSMLPLHSSDLHLSSCLLANGDPNQVIAQIETLIDSLRSGGTPPCQSLEAGNGRRPEVGWNSTRSIPRGW